MEYDLDFLDKKLNIRVSFIIQDGDNQVLTPIPNLLQQRFLEVESKRARAYVKPQALDMRQVQTIWSGIEQAYVNRTVYNPYKPGINEHKELIKEVQQIGDNRLVCVEYKGEVWKSSLEELL